MLVFFGFEMVADFTVKKKHDKQTDEDRKENSTTGELWAPPID